MVNSPRLNPNPNPFSRGEISISPNPKPKESKPISKFISLKSIFGKINQSGSNKPNLPNNPKKSKSTSPSILSANISPILNL